MIFLGSLMMIISSEGLRSLFRPKRSLLGVSRSRFSRSPVKLPNPIGRLLMQFDICAAIVSHWSRESRWFEIDFSNDWLISFIFLSTLPCMLWPPTGHTSKSTLTFLEIWDWASLKFSFISWHPFISWLPSSHSNFLGKPTSHENLIKDSTNEGVL